MAVKGKDVLIYEGPIGTMPIIAGAKSCTVSTSCDLMEKASSTAARQREYIAGRQDWEVSLNHLVTAVDPFHGVLAPGNTYFLRIVIGNATLTGRAICQQADITGTKGNLATGAIKFKGISPLVEPED